MSTVNFNVGDIVRIKETLECGHIYQGWNVNEDMLKHLGETFLISSIEDDRFCGKNYRLKGYEVWGWTDEMLEFAIQAADNDYDNRDIESCENEINKTPITDLLSLYGK